MVSIVRSVLLSSVLNRKWKHVESEGLEHIGRQSLSTSYLASNDIDSTIYHEFRISVTYLVDTVSSACPDLLSTLILDKDRISLSTVDGADKIYTCILPFHGDISGEQKRKLIARLNELSVGKENWSPGL